MAVIYICDRCGKNCSVPGHIEDKHMNYRPLYSFSSLRGADKSPLLDDGEGYELWTGELCDECLAAAKEFFHLE